MVPKPARAINGRGALGAELALAGSLCGLGSAFSLLAGSGSAQRRTLQLRVESQQAWSHSAGRAAAAAVVAVTAGTGAARLRRALRRCSGRSDVSTRLLEVRAGRIRRQPPSDSEGDEPLVSAPAAEEKPWFSESDLDGLKVLILGNPLNLLLAFVPLSLASESLGWGDVSTFALSFVAIVPLAKLLGEATEQLACSVGQTLGGLLNATFGNAVEMIIAVYALRDGLTEVVKGSLVGSIISNLLLVLGMCFFFGGINYKVQRFSATGARAQYSLLLLAVLALVIPTVVLLTGARPEMELLMSRGCAVILALLYVCYLVFQLVTHKDDFAPVEDSSTAAGQAQEEEEVLLSPGAAVVLLFLSTALVAPLSEGLTGSVEGVTKTLGISDAFVGVVLLPIVGNAAEHLTAVTVATKDKMDLSLGVALGSSTQIALFVVPFAVITGWILGVPMDLNFKPLDASILLLTVLIVGSTIADGESNWLEGAALIAAYLLIAVSLWFM
eukprot:TRINITY_DN62918_c0_g1_i1.p1 TRINITY_DN62918_c0_g1~~TRINITY_DN62918_c0_g1_i1.p1  ORF type:complete len:510 (+),score=104.57 TRINITY_DN62918_c0_g1_i1:34-1530(+)